MVPRISNVDVASTYLVPDEVARALAASSAWQSPPLGRKPDFRGLRYSGTRSSQDPQWADFPDYISTTVGVRWAGR